MVWEESIIAAPKNARFAFLSATIPNAFVGAGWGCGVWGGSSRLGLRGWGRVCVPVCLVHHLLRQRGVCVLLQHSMHASVHVHVCVCAPPHPTPNLTLTLTYRSLRSGCPRHTGRPAMWYTPTTAPPPCSTTCSPQVVSSGGCGLYNLGFRVRA